MKKKMIIIPHLEWHISHSCNLTCESCIHFTNHNHNEIVSIEKLKEWYSLWNKKLSPKRMVLLGGEPLLNKNIVEIVYLTREMWNQPKNGNYWITTNGLLLENYSKLPIALRENKCMLQISIHGDKNTKEYYKKIKKIFTLVEDWDKKYNIKLINCNTDNPLYEELEYYFSTEVVPRGYIKVLEKVGYEEIGKMTLDEIAQMGSELLSQNEE